MRIVVCGGRHYANVEFVARVMEAVARKHGRFEIIEGECPYGGADKLAREWGEANGMPVVPVPAKGRAFLARNQRMVDMKPDACIAFPGGGGTADMCRRAEAAGIPVWRLREHEDRMTGYDCFEPPVAAGAVP